MFISSTADLGNLLRFGFTDVLKPRLEKLAETLSEDLTGGAMTRDEYKFCSERLKKFAHVQKKLQSLAPIG